MTSCLTLIRDRHIPAAASLEGFSGTACGLAIPTEYVEEYFFASSTEVTCANCRRTLTAKVARPEFSPAADGRMVVKFLLEDLAAGRIERLTQLLEAGLARRFAPHVERMRDLFPNATISVTEMIAEGDVIVTRFGITCNDVSGLLGGGPISRDDQFVMFRLARGLVAGFTAVVDALGLWAPLRPADGTGTGAASFESAKSS